jgi:hypothetical protein
MPSGVLVAIKAVALVASNVIAELLFACAIAAWRRITFVKIQGAVFTIMPFCACALISVDVHR